MNVKKLILPFIILIVLVMYLVYITQTNGVSDQPYSDFEIADTASVAKITISRTTGETITLDRNNDSKLWMIEGTEYEANKPSLDLLLKTFTQWKVMQDVEPKKTDITVRLLATKHTKIQVYGKGDNKPFKTIYIGDHNPSMTGNFALLQKGNKKSSVPYLINMPGFYGTLETRFFANKNGWRSARIIELESREVKAVALKIYKEINESYSFSVDGDVFNLVDGQNKNVAVFDTLALRRHLVSFQQLYSENFVTSMTAAQQDSVINSTPLYELSVTDTNNKTTNIVVYCKKPDSEHNAADGSVLPCDPQRLYAHVDKKDFVVIQTFGWGNVFKPLSYFTEP